MSVTALLFYIVGIFILGATLFAIGYFVRKRFAERLIRTAEYKAREILVSAKRESEDILKRADRDSKTVLFKAQKEFDDKFAQTKRDLENLQKVLANKEEILDQKNIGIEKKDREALFRLQEAANREKELVNRAQALDKLIADERAALTRVSGLDADAAKKELLKRMEIDIRSDAGKLIRDIESQARDEADKKAKKILSLA